MPYKDKEAAKAFRERNKADPVKRAYRREWFRKLRSHPDYPLYQMNKWLKTMYGITLKDYERMFMLQDGLCKICGGKGKVHRGRIRTLHVDHDHTTGKIRGLLCHSCNVWLHVLEHPDWLLKAQAYLASHG